MGFDMEEWGMGGDGGTEGPKAGEGGKGEKRKGRGSKRLVNRLTSQSRDSEKVMPMSTKNRIT